MNNILTEQQLEEFKILCNPLIKWLCDNFDPYIKIEIDNKSASLKDSPISCYTNDEFIIEKY